MSRIPSFPTLLDECKTVSISDLKRWEYLKPYQIRSGVITWSRNGSKTGSISIKVNTFIENHYLELDYLCNDIPINYTVKIVSIPSNLGQGKVMFFECPRTGKRCRKLYQVHTYFYHRSAFKGCMYDSQTKSHKNRRLLKLYEKLFVSDKAYEKIYSKHFKKKYNGKPTKRYLKLKKQLETECEFSEVELLLS